MKMKTKILTCVVTEIDKNEGIVSVDIFCKESQEEARATMYLSSIPFDVRLSDVFSVIFKDNKYHIEKVEHTRLPQQTINKVAKWLQSEMKKILNK